MGLRPNGTVSTLRGAAGCRCGVGWASFIGCGVFLHLEEQGDASLCKGRGPVAMAIANLRKR